MLKNWKISNFKSFVDDTTIPLTRINVIAGANSSGKSSLIQTILLLKQTLQYGATNRSIALNGPLLRLGTFSDVLNFSGKTPELSISFRLEAPSSSLPSQRPAPWLQALGRNWSHGEQRSTNIECTVSWTGTAKSATGTLVPTLHRGSLNIDRETAADSSQRYYVSYDPRQRDSNDPAEIYPQIGAGAFHMALDPISTAELGENRPEFKILGGDISYFLPNTVSVEYDAMAQHAREFAVAVCRGSSLFSSVSLDDEEVSPRLISAIDEWLLSRALPPLNIHSDGDDISGSTLASALNYSLRQSAGYALKRLAIGPNDFVDSLQTIIASIYIEEAGSYRDIDYPQPRHIRAAADFIQSYFRLGVRYLGPLRDVPKPVYQLEALENTTDVGYRGEHTAAVLDLNANRVVQYVTPPGKEGQIGTTRTASLHDAVVDWMVYLGVARDVVTTDAGVYGNRLQVGMEGNDRLHDLTNVGVGVSQVLPIVVTSLLAPPTSTLIFEQPELHLHPKVQSRLGDFFLALAADNKRTILETHSEHIIDRLRLRIAESSSDTEKQWVSIFFTSKEFGKTTLTPVDISEYGAITNWPKDFFDESEIETSKILTAAAKKRIARRDASSK